MAPIHNLVLSYVFCKCVSVRVDAEDEDYGDIALEARSGKSTQDAEQRLNTSSFNVSQPPLDIQAHVDTGDHWVLGHSPKNASAQRFDMEGSLMQKVHTILGHSPENASAQRFDMVVGSLMQKTSTVLEDMDMNMRIIFLGLSVTTGACAAFCCYSLCAPGDLVGSRRSSVRGSISSNRSNPPRPRKSLRRASFLGQEADGNDDSKTLKSPVKSALPSTHYEATSSSSPYPGEAEEVPAMPVSAPIDDKDLGPTRFKTKVKSAMALASLRSQYGGDLDERLARVRQKVQAAGASDASQQRRPSQASSEAPELAEIREKQGIARRPTTASGSSTYINSGPEPGTAFHYKKQQSEEENTW